MPITVIECPAARFNVTTKRGTRQEITFTIVGRADLASATWAGVARRGPETVTLGVTAALATVTTADDSVEVAVELTAAQSTAMRLGGYRFDVMDTGADEVWATGRIVIARNEVVPYQAAP